MLQQNLIISLPTYPKICWYATGTTHIFHLGLMEILLDMDLTRNFFVLCTNLTVYINIHSGRSLSSIIMKQRVNKSESSPYLLSRALLKLEILPV